MTRNPYYSKFGLRKPNEVLDIAISATRSYMRSIGLDPDECDSDSAIRALDDIGRSDAKEETIAVRFARYASISQIKKFQSVWNRNKKKAAREKAAIAAITNA